MIDGSGQISSSMRVVKVAVNRVLDPLSMETRSEELKTPENYFFAQTTHGEFFQVQDVQDMGFLSMLCV